MAVVALALFVLGAERPIVVARLYGGPTEDQAQLAVRLVLSQRDAVSERPYGAAPVRLEVRTDRGLTATWRGSTDARGAAEVVLEAESKRHADLRLWLGPAARPLAEGRVSLSRAGWLARARRSGGMIAGSTNGDLWIEAAPARGVFAIGSSDPLLVQVRRPAGTARVELELAADGGLINDSLQPVSVVTNRQGRALVSLTPQEPVVMLTITARAANALGRWHGRVPVVQGATHARFMKSVLLLESPVEARDAFISFIDQQGRIAGALPVLRADGKGGAIAIVPVPADRGLPMWAVVSSDPDQTGAATLGWPIAAPEALLANSGELPETAFGWAVPDAVLLDSAAAAGRRETERRRHARRIALSMGLLSFLLIAALVTLDVYASRVPAALAQQLPGQRKLSALLGSALGLVVALLCIALGFAVLTLVAYFRLT
jgi:hypothetical protein